MPFFETLALLLTVTAAFAYVNHRWLGQPASVALMAMTLGVSLALLGAAELVRSGSRRRLVSAPAAKPV